MEPTIFQESLDYLTKHPLEIYNAWCDPTDHEGGALFQFTTPTGCRDVDADGYACGCLTQIRLSHHNGDPFPHQCYIPELTAKIANDERIPCHAKDIQPEHLPVFQEWQERLDREFKNRGFRKEIGCNRGA